ncbi:MAG TPA: copper transporter [Nocardioidaceae bacterium]|nr:copper transporter [Nocardioidaceae bacterium]
MISFRYHIVSIVSVFLALAVGVALGGGPLKGTVDNTLVRQVHHDRTVKKQLQRQINELQGGHAFTDSFAATVAPKLLAHTLSGHVVDMVVLPTASQSDVTSLDQMVSTAGGTVGGTLQVGTGMVDVANKQLVGELGSQLEDGASGVSIPSSASAYERMGSLIARAIGTDHAGGAAVDSTAQGILAGLSTANLMSAEGDLHRRGDLILFVAGPGSNDKQQQRGRATIVTTLAQAVDADTAGVVVAGPVAAARGDGAVKAVRQSVAAARVVSTVDSLHRTAGQVVTIMALAEQAEGKTGHYGAVDAADGAMPGAATGGE